MDIGQRYIDHGTIDAAGLRDAVLACPEDLWYVDDGLRDHLAKGRPTQSLFLLRISPHDVCNAIRHRSIEQDDVAKHSSWLKLREAVAPILKKIRETYGPDGVFVSVQIARLPAGAEITPHIDSAQLLRNSHRLHVPLVTNENVEFCIDGERVDLKPERLYEINNNVLHGVENLGDDARLHLIVDYLPPDRNNDQCLQVTRVEKKIAATTRRFEDMGLPKLLATSVVRGAHQSESHGGIFLVDMQTSSVEQKYDWDRGDIDFQGRGWDRGLRGIAFYEDEIYIAASDEIFVFNQNFEITASFKNAYLKHAHEVCIHNGKLYVASTGYDSVLRFDLQQRVFDRGLLVRRSDDSKVSLDIYDPNANAGPEFKNTLHINQVFVNDNGLHFSGRRMPFLMRVNGNGASKYCQLPSGTHNAQPFKNGALVNDTNSDRVVFFDALQYTEISVPSFAEDDLSHIEYSDQQLARQSFGRGLCTSGDLVFAGSSPSTISAYDLKSKMRVKSVNVSMDIRNAVHGLAVWPY